MRDHFFSPDTRQRCHYILADTNTTCTYINTLTAPLIQTVSCLLPTECELLAKCELELTIEACQVTLRVGQDERIDTLPEKVLSLLVSYDIILILI